MRTKTIRLMTVQSVVIIALLSANLAVNFRILRQASQIRPVDERVILRDLSYYRNHLITADNLSSLPSSEAYFLYFHDAFCSACVETDAIVAAYIDYGYYQAKRIYFIEASSDDKTLDAINERFNLSLETVPLLAVIENGHVEVLKEGAQEIFKLLDDVVQEVSQS